MISFLERFLRKGGSELLLILGLAAFSLSRESPDADPSCYLLYAVMAGWELTVIILDARISRRDRTLALSISAHTNCFRDLAIKYMISKTKEAKTAYEKKYDEILRIFLFHIPSYTQDTLRKEMLLAAQYSSYEYFVLTGGPECVLVELKQYFNQEEFENFCGAEYYEKVIQIKRMEQEYNKTGRIPYSAPVRA